MEGHRQNLIWIGGAGGITEGANIMRMGEVERLFVNSSGHSQRVSRRAERLLRYINLEPDQKYLDVGTGNGAVPIHMAQEYGLHATGVDIDPNQIKIAEDNSVGIPHARFLTVDGIQLPFENNEFDIVSAFKVTHHIPNWQEALAEMLRVLKPCGYFVYVDFVFPEWLAPLGQCIVRDKAGVPTLTGLNVLIQEYTLCPIYWSKPFMQYEGVFQKNKFYREEQPSKLEGKTN
jgi:ubiquinone/menaquinone biosynthesis C-methylase UbiE